LRLFLHPTRLSTQVRDYLLALESHLSEAHRQASRLTAKEVELGEAVLEFGQVGRYRRAPGSAFTTAGSVANRQCFKR